MDECKRHEICGREALEGDELCILHSEKREKDRDAFRKALAEHREKQVDDYRFFFFPEYANFSSTDFAEKAYFSGVQFTEGATFARAKFHRESEFSWAQFLWDTNFSDVEFKGEARFEHVKLAGEPRFERAAFARDVYFSQTSFFGRVDFTSAKFSGGIDFLGATFRRDPHAVSTASKGEVSFNRAEFTGRTSFTGARFSVGADFSGAKFVSKPHFIYAVFEQGTAFTRATFPEGVHFVRTKFGGLANFNSAIFGNETQFASAAFLEKASFCHARLSGRTFFASADDVARSPEVMDEIDRLLVNAFCDEEQNAMRTEASSPFFEAHVDFRNVIVEPPEALAFRDADLSRWRFLGTDLRKAQFTSVEWPRIPSKKVPRFVRARWPEIGTRTAVRDDILATEIGRTDDYPHIEQLYRQLKQNYEDRRDHGRAGDFHYGEKEMLRRNPKTGWPLWLLLTLYCCLSGYGERYWRPLIAAGLLVALCTAAYLVFGLSPSASDAAPLNWGDWHKAARYSFQVMTLLKPVDLVPVGEVGKWVHAFESILGPLLIGLFALALRQRLKR